MATEKRLIDVTKEIQAMYSIPETRRILETDSNARKVIDWFIHAPTVDAVEVVRCKDCKWYCTAPYDNVPYCSHESGYCGEHMGGLFFCSCGERKDDG